MSDPIIEAAARALSDKPRLLRPWNAQSENAREWYRELARTAIAAATPLIEAAALERAADIADGEDCPHCAAAIRSLKEQPAESSAA